ncbi:MAG: alginate export family protein [Phycisphaerae bacterium]
MRHIRTFGLVMGWILIFFISFASAQVEKSQSYTNQQRQVEESVRLQLDRDLPANQKVLLDYGGWLSSYFFIFDDGIKNRTLRRQDLRVWGSMNADDGIHQGYARMKLGYSDFNHGDGYDGDEDDFERPRLDRGWYQLDLAKLLRKRASVDVPFDLAIKIGRDYAMFGTGYALSMPMDMIQINGGIGPFKIDGLLGRTIHSWDNLDTSRPRPGDSWRYFYGVQARYTGLAKHEPFVYYVWQKDRQHDGNPLLKLQEWRYNSEYLGAGSTGQILQNWRYSGEMVYESGESYADQTIFHQDEISAYGWDLKLEYLAPWKLHPKFSLEYMFASGDADRIFSPSNAVGGNRYGTHDTGFNGFGYRNTGLAMAPDLSNIHIWRAGASFFPLENFRKDLLKKLELGTDWFLYNKNKGNAAISDPLADQQSGYLGWEMDYFANWRFTSDLAWTIRYGAFFPGKAYSDETTRTFFLTGITWSF